MTARRSLQAVGPGKLTRYGCRRSFISADGQLYKSN